MIAATIKTRLGMVWLSVKTGKWEGAEPDATMANAIATLQDATPDKGDPVRWAVNEVNRVLRGVVDLPEPEKKPEQNDGRVY